MTNTADKLNRAFHQERASRQKQLKTLWAMTAEERISAMRRGELSYWQLYNWAARAKHELPLLNGEFEFIAISTPEIADLTERVPALH